MRRTTAGLLAGLLLAGGAPLTWYVLDDRAPADFGPSVAERAGVVDPEPAAGAAVGAAPAPPTSSARLGDQLRDIDPPVRVTVGGEQAEVDAVGVVADGQVEVPDDVSRVGWYSPGVRPGSASGSAVLVGHVDDAEQGFGAFATLLDSEPGNVVSVRTESGAELVYDIVARQQLEKSTVPMDQLFSTEGAPRLVLITCGGDFDPAARSYGDNVVVTAAPRT